MSSEAEKTTLLEAELYILRHLVTGYTQMPAEDYFKAVAVWRGDFIQRHDSDTGNTDNGVKFLGDLPETVAFYKRITGRE